MNPKLSLVITVNSKSPNIRSLMDSICAQNVENVEYICVNSTNDFEVTDVLSAYSESLPKLKLFNNGANTGLVEGVLSSAGEYVMLLDENCYLNPDAYRKVIEAIESTNADVLQFSAGVISEKSCFDPVGISEETSVVAFDKSIQNDSALLHEEGWEIIMHPEILCNKIYRGDIARSVSVQIRDEALVCEPYSFNVLFSMRALSYSGWDRRLLVIGRHSHTEQNSQYYKQASDLCNYIAGLLNQKNSSSDEILAIRRHYIGLGIDDYLSKATRGEGPGFLDEMKNVWGLENIIDTVSVLSIQQRSELAEAFANENLFKSHKRDTSGKITIASYYMNLSNGGIERVMSIICSMLAEATDNAGNRKYNVVMITDEENEDLLPSYTYSPLIKREYLPVVKNGEDFNRRFCEWQRIISDYNVDVVISNRWSAEFFPDALSIKGHANRPLLINHFHYSLTNIYAIRSALAQYQAKYYGFIDGVVSLSNCDERLAKAFARHAKYIPNPMTFRPVDSDIDYEENSILWMARFARQKQPVEILKVMEYVVQDIPEAKLYMVGTGEEEAVKEIEREIAKRRLENNIVLCGFSDTVEEYYGKAAVFAMTSLSEGYPMTLVEAASFGVPTVMYDLPWLSMVEDGRGIVAVPQMNCVRMAKEIIKVLKNSEYRKTLSKDIKLQAVELSKVDILKEWEDFFVEINTEKESVASDNTEDHIFKLITQYQNEAKLLWHDQYSAEKRKADYYFRKMDENSRKAEAMQTVAASNWEARNKALEEASKNWEARNRAIDEASENWKARNKAIDEASKNWEARNKALEEASKNWEARNKAVNEAAENWKARNKAVDEAAENWKARNKALEEASKNWEARNKALEEASKNWEARNKALEKAAENWKAREEMQEKQKYAWEKRTEAIAMKNAILKEKNRIEKELEEIQERFTELENSEIDTKWQNLELQAKMEEMQKEFDELDNSFVELAKKYKAVTEHWSYKLFGKKQK